MVGDFPLPELPCCWLRWHGVLAHVSALCSHLHVFQGCQKCKGSQPHSQSREFHLSWLSSGVALPVIRCGSCQVDLQRFLHCRPWTWRPSKDVIWLAKVTVDDANLLLQAEVPTLLA